MANVSVCDVSATTVFGLLSVAFSSSALCFVPTNVSVWCLTFIYLIDFLCPVLKSTPFMLTAIVASLAHMPQPAAETFLIASFLSYFVHYELARPQIAQDADAEKSNAASRATEDLSSSTSVSPVASI